MADVRSVTDIRRKLVEGTQHPFWVALTADECSSLVDLIDAAKEVVPWIQRPQDVRENEVGALAEIRGDLMNAIGEGDRTLPIGWCHARGDHEAHAYIYMDAKYWCRGLDARRRLV